MSQNRGDSVASSNQQQQQASFLERQKAKWKPDQLATNCDRCSQPFGLLRRKHHCRRCGGIFCDPCCAARVNLPGFGIEAQRVCKICEAILGATSPAGLMMMSSATTNNNNNNNNNTTTGATGNATSSLQNPAGGLSGLISRISGLGNTQNSASAASPTAKKPGAGSDNSSVNLGRSNSSTAGGANSASPTSAQQQHQRSGLGNQRNFPSLELFPRERRILIIGSPGVGKGSFIATACGSADQQQQQHQTTTTTASAAYSSINSASTSPNFNPASSGRYNNSNNNTIPSQQEGSLGYATTSASGVGVGGNNFVDGAGAVATSSSSSSSLNEKRRTIPFGGHLYSLVLVNTAGSTVSSELFVHPLLTIGTSGYILMYDITEPKSFEVLALLQERLLDCGAQDKAMILLGSKADHVSAGGAGRERVVSKDAALKLANHWKAPYVDVSCTSKESVDFALMELVKEIAARDTY